MGAPHAQVNHRRLLDAYLGACGVPLSAVRTVCSSIDKLDKTPWPEVRDELLNEKHLEPQVADRIAHYVKLAGERPYIEFIMRLIFCVVSVYRTNFLRDLRAPTLT